MKKKIMVALLTWLIPVLGLASNPGTTGGVLLKKNISPRVESLAESYVAMADDVYAMYVNPAGLARMVRPQITSSYNTGLYDDSLGMIAGAFPLDEKWSAGAGIAYYNAGLFDLTDSNGDTLRRITAQSDYLIQATGAYQMLDTLTLGATLKLLLSTLAEEDHGQALAMDLGVMYRPNLDILQNKIRLGLAIQNAGTPMSYGGPGDPLPLTVRLGAMCDIFNSESNKGSWHDLRLAMEANTSIDTDPRFNLGAEYCFAHTVIARIGYKLNQDLQGLTAGLGLEYEVLQGYPVSVDYAFSLVQKFNSTHKVSMTFGLAKTPNRLSDAQQDERKAQANALLQAQKVEAERAAEAAAQEKTKAEAEALDRKFTELQELILNTSSTSELKLKQETIAYLTSMNKAGNVNPHDFKDEAEYQAYVDKRVREIISQMGLDKQAEGDIFEKLRKYISRVIKETF